MCFWEPGFPEHIPVAACRVSDITTAFVEGIPEIRMPAIQASKIQIVGWFFHRVQKLIGIHVWYIYYIYISNWFLNGKCIGFLVNIPYINLCLGSLGSCICQTPHLAKPGEARSETVGVFNEVFEHSMCTSVDQLGSYTLAQNAYNCVFWCICFSIGQWWNMDLKKS